MVVMPSTDRLNTSKAFSSLSPPRLTYLSFSPLSFNSLNLILPALAKILVDGGQVVALVKPQFEAGREQIGKNGIVRESSVHEKVLETVTAFAVDYGFSVKGLDFSPIQGGHGNIEFLAHLEKTNSPQNDAQTSDRKSVV